MEVVFYYLNFQMNTAGSQLGETTTDFRLERTDVDEEINIDELRTKYNNLCVKIVEQLATDEGRWPVFCELAKIRQQLTALNIPRHQLAITETDQDSLEQRAFTLIQGIFAHFQTDPLCVSDNADFEQFLLSALSKLKTATAWDDSLQRVDISNGVSAYCTTQEDVLFQELIAIANHLNKPLIQDLIYYVRLLRSRDAAAVLYKLFGEKLSLSVGQKIFSYGAGLAQFEELLAERFQIQVTAYDLQDFRQSDKQKDSRVTFLTDLNSVENQRYDVVILKDVLHEVSDPRDILNFLKSHLAACGKVLVIEPNAMPGNLEAMQELDSTPFKENLHDMEYWKQFFQDNGFAVEAQQDFQPGQIDCGDHFPRCFLIFNS